MTTVKNTTIIPKPRILILSIIILVLTAPLAAQDVLRIQPGTGDQELTGRFISYLEDQDGRFTIAAIS
ncbi:MAG: hypothetical protein E4G96_09135 [Chrysiogenales bacterium]|nr:MAG: hypothetical protein E4G96_09135 [Chrysiogenales bacterium]